MASRREQTLTHQPWKAIYSVLVFILTLIRVPFYVACYSLPSLRQHPKWTFKQALMNKLFKKFLYHAAIVEVHTPLLLNPKAQDLRLARIKPAPANLFCGNTVDPDIKPSIVEGTWYPSVYDKGDEQKYNIILHFHGGGYAMCEGSAGDSGYAANLLVAHAAAKVLFPTYRLASNEGGRYPASLQDAISAYKYLLDLGIPSDKIVLSGDSAGGNLALSLLRYVAENHHVLPGPSSLLLWSPTTDLNAARKPEVMDQNRHSSTDFLPGRFCAWGADGLIMDAPSTAAPYFSPKKFPFTTNVPLWIHLGGLEILYDDAVEFAENMRLHGNAVELHVEPYANHDVLYLGGSTGFTVEAIKGARLAGKFLAERGGIKPEIL